MFENPGRQYYIFLLFQYPFIFFSFHPLPIWANPIYANYWGLSCPDEKNRVIAGEFFLAELFKPSSFPEIGQVVFELHIHAKGELYPGHEGVLYRFHAVGKPDAEFILDLVLKLLLLVMKGELNLVPGKKEHEIQLAQLQANRDAQVVCPVFHLHRRSGLLINKSHVSDTQAGEKTDCIGKIKVHEALYIENG